MRRLVFCTQRLDPDDPVLAATVPMVRALADRVDELVVLCDTATVELDGVRVQEFGARRQLQRGARFERALAGEVRGSDAVVAHMVPLYAVIAAPLVRPLRIPLALWYTHWKAHAVVRAAEKVCTHILSVDERSFPLRSSKVRGIGHGIDVSEFSCSDEPDGPARALVLGRYSPAKGLETILRACELAGVGVEAHGSDATFEDYARGLRRSFPRAELGGALPRSALPSLFARSHVLVNNMRAGATDKVVYEACASCTLAIASNPAFDSLLPDELRFDREDPGALAERLLALGAEPPDRRDELGRVLRERVAASHSVESWADAVVEAAT